MSVTIGPANSYIDSLTSQAKNNAKTNSQKVNSSVNNLSADSTKEELEDAVKSFETYFVEEMLKQMKDSVKVFGDDKSSDALTDYYMDFAVTEVAQQMVDKYGARVTEDFVKQIQRNYGIPEDSTDIKDSSN